MAIDKVDLEIHEDKQLERVFLELSANETDMEAVEKDVENYRIKKTQALYESRRDLLKQIPNFWYVVLAQHEDFSEYLQTDDLRYIEYIKNIHVQWKINDSEGDNTRKFDITFEFSSSDKVKFADQIVTKQFQEINDPDTGKPRLISTPVSIEWPSSYDKINPLKIKRKGLISTKEDKKNYRQGMKSFFAWFSWTGMRPGKEFRSGEDLTRLIIDDIFPDSVKYYTDAMSADLEDADDDEEVSSSDELDLSEDEDDGAPKRPIEDDVEETSAKKLKSP
ncbi:unnamed protein product [Kuraishia capsulata CBS 1993]|uniref:Vacuolar protein sorting-associated protein 75 n=1 Tax=Kuraishia capsulata CBS 1993 TaxID=1382522 RepID=W6MX04_9ASCO|nr:uncharacterized protein KUCA_T00004036001 [Kuraishia capsulata CBS 1993]CDK28055.1 unnamed protein product [Kuraishia capsulata CBS 1993]